MQREQSLPASSSRGQRARIGTARSGIPAAKRRYSDTPRMRHVATSHTPCPASEWNWNIGSEAVRWSALANDVNIECDPKFRKVLRLLALKLCTHSKLHYLTAGKGLHISVGMPALLQV